MKSKPSWLHGGEPNAVADRADVPAHSDSHLEIQTPKVVRRNVLASERRRLQLMELAEREEEVRLEAVLDDELVDEIAAAYGIEFQDGFERALLCEAIKAERIWQEKPVCDPHSRSRKATRESRT